MEKLSNLIINRILQDGEVTLAQLEQRAQERAVSLSDLYQALTVVHRDKRIKRGVRQGEIVYTKATPPKSPTDHTAWVRTHYPKMDSTNDGSGIEANFDYLFLTPEQLVEYKAKAKGVSVHMVQSRYGKNYKKAV
jgi:hypothetical protein